MKRNEFLEQLKSALENEMDAQKVKENLEYYDEYIRTEMKKGLSEDEVLSQLGDPWALAKTIILSSKMEGQAHSRSSQTMSEHGIAEAQKEDFSAKWKVWIPVAIAVIVLGALLSVLFGALALVFQLVIKFAVPILVVVLAIKIFGKK